MMITIRTTYRVGPDGNWIDIVAKNDRGVCLAADSLMQCCEHDLFDEQVRVASAARRAIMASDAWRNIQTQQCEAARMAAEDWERGSTNLHYSILSGELQGELESMTEIVLEPATGVRAGLYADEVIA